MLRGNISLLLSFTKELGLVNLHSHFSTSCSSLLVPEITESKTLFLTSIFFSGLSDALSPQNYYYFRVPEHFKCKFYITDAFLRLYLIYFNRHLIIFLPQSVIG